MKAKSGAGLVIAIVGAVLLSSCLVAKTTNTQTVGPPRSGVTAFGSAFAMDEGRLLVRGMRSGRPEIYVFDASESGWTHSATITPPGWSTASWGTSMAVSGDTIAITDPGRVTGTPGQYGEVQLYNFISDGWPFKTLFFGPKLYTHFGMGIWLSRNGMVVRSCDSTSCATDEWNLYQRSGGVFKPAYTSRPERGGIGVSVGVDQGRIAVGNPGDWSIEQANNGLMVFDANVRLPAILLDELIPTNTGEDNQLFRKVDLSGDVLAYESGTDATSTLHIRRWDGSAYQTEATIPLPSSSAGVAVLPGVVLVANPTAHIWQTYVFSDGSWARSKNLTVPDTTAGKFQVPPVAVGNKVAVQGNGVVHVMTIEAIDTANT